MVLSCAKTYVQIVSIKNDNGTYFLLFLLMTIIQPINI